MNLTISKERSMTNSITKDLIIAEAGKSRNVKTIQEAFDGFTSFAVFRKENCEKEIIDAVCILIIRFNKYFATNQQMNPEQIRLTATEITRTHYYFSLADIKLVFDSMKKEKIFGQLSHNVILERLVKYESHRLDVAESVSLNKHKSKKSESAGADIRVWYENFELHGIPETERERSEKKEREFQKFKAEYNTRCRLGEAGKANIKQKHNDQVYTK